MNLKKVLGSLAVLACVGMFASSAHADTTGSGSVAVTATTVASVQMTFSTNASGLALTGSGTSAATAAFGSVQAYGGTVPTNVSRTVNGTTDWSLSTPFDVMVHVANQTSSNYTLTAVLNGAASGYDLTVDTSVLDESTPAELTATGTYDSAQSHTLKLTIPFATAAGAISNTINFVATAN